MKRSYQELVAHNANTRRALADGIEARLRSIPGVHYVTTGVRIRGGRPTDDIGITVYVHEKRPERDIPASERIPREIDGIPIDVNVVRPAQFRTNNTRYRNVKGGIQISNNILSIIPSEGYAAIDWGTFGCTATLDADQTVVLLTCAHVLSARGGTKPNWVYQPAAIEWWGITASELPKTLDVEDNRIARIVNAINSDKVDAGIAALDLSSCCRCCGLDYDDEIVGLSSGGVPPTNQIVDVRAATEGLNVIKVGATTGRSTGVVTITNGPPFSITEDGTTRSYSGQIDIVSTDDKPSFTEAGDSGSLVVDEEGYAVGLAFAGQILSDVSHANHIQDVTAQLGITIRTAGMKHLSGSRISVPIDVRDSRSSMTAAELYAESRARLLAEPAGEWLWNLAETHREEIVSLVTKRRPVTVAWHRAHGPALFAAAIHALRDNSRNLPAPLDGSTLADSLAKIGDALAAHGSPALRAALTEHRERLLASVRDSATFDDVLAKLHDVPVGASHAT